MQSTDQKDTEIGQLLEYISLFKVDNLFWSSHKEVASDTRETRDLATTSNSFACFCPGIFENHNDTPNSRMPVRNNC